MALAHLDGNGTDEAVSTMVARVQELAFGYPEGRIELQLIGGFKDTQGYAEDLFSNIMRKCTATLRIFRHLNASLQSTLSPCISHQNNNRRLSQDTSWHCNLRLLRRVLLIIIYDFNPRSTTFQRHIPPNPSYPPRSDSTPSYDDHRHRLGRHHKRISTPTTAASHRRTSHRY